MKKSMALINAVRSVALDLGAVASAPAMDLVFLIAV